VRGLLIGGWSDRCSLAFEEVQIHHPGSLPAALKAPACYPDGCSM